MSIFFLIKSDYKKYKSYGGSFFGIVFLTQGFWAAFQYRVASGISKKISVPLFRVPLMGLLILWQKCIEILTGISIPASARIGESFYIGHFGGIIIHPDAVIGSNCNISQGVTIGISGTNDNRGVPVISDNVYFGANAVVVGKITIGNNVLIGANSLVKSSLPDHAVALGVPAEIISYGGSNSYL
jgi:serine O-acetyltransferase